MYNNHKSHIVSHNLTKKEQIVLNTVYDLKYTQEPLIVYFSMSDTPLANNPKAYTKGFSYELSRWEDFYKITQKFSYSNANFKDGYRKAENIISFGNLLIFDVDNNYDINQVRTDLKGVKSLIVTTRSHTKEHHKFRIIIPVDGCLNADVSKELYKEILRVTAEQICNLEADKLDKACFGLDRQYAPNKDQQYRYIRGEVVPLEPIIKIANNNLLTNAVKNVEPIKINHTRSNSNLSYADKRDFIKQSFTPDFMERLLVQKGLTVCNDGKVLISGNNTKAISLDLKSGYVRDFAKDVSYDPVSLLFDVYHDGTLTEITDTIYEQLKASA